MVTEATARRASAQRAVGASTALTKPRIIELLVVTTLPSMVVADRVLRDACDDQVDAARALRLFGLSIPSLMALFASMAVDVLLRHH
jgi:heme O synthase-like polyprenyltransferase